ncbi:methyltransferase [Candidatus Amarolinea dominans]|uniref:methyltransferase n=1 Tax=Candidatus Amarolinea dominans TaxID=3140696 RepID=UPI0031CCBC28
MTSPRSALSAMSAAARAPFLKRVMEANPHLRGILYDLPGVVANHVLGELDDRVEVVAGSFFERALGRPADPESRVARLVRREVRGHPGTLLASHVARIEIADH